MNLTSSYTRVAAWYSRNPFYQRLVALRSEMAKAAQAVYDNWYQDEEGFDEMYGGGGICHDVADAVLNVIYRHIPEMVGTTISQSCGENHVFAVVSLGEEGYLVDIHPSVYETGGGYSWKKIPDVEIGPEDISIEWVSPDDVQSAIEYDG